MTTPEVATAGFVYYRFRKPSYTGEERKSMIDRALVTYGRRA